MSCLLSHFRMVNSFLTPDRARVQRYSSCRECRSRRLKAATDYLWQTENGESKAFLKIIFKKLQLTYIITLVSGVHPSD